MHIKIYYWGPVNLAKIQIAMPQSIVFVWSAIWYKITTIMSSYFLQFLFLCYQRLANILNMSALISFFGKQYIYSLLIYKDIYKAFNSLPINEAIFFSVTIKNLRNLSLFDYWIVIVRNVFSSNMGNINPHYTYDIIQHTPYRHLTEIP